VMLGTSPKAAAMTSTAAGAIEKCEVFQIFTVACTLPFRDVCGLVNYICYGSRADPASSGSLAKVVAANLEQRGIIKFDELRRPENVDALVKFWPSATCGWSSTTSLLLSTPALGCHRSSIEHLTRRILANVSFIYCVRVCVPLPSTRPA